MSDENALALSQEDIAALVPASIDEITSSEHRHSAKPEQRWVNVPYVGFRGKKSTKNVEALQAAGVGVQEFYLQDVEPLKVQPMGFHVLQFARFFTNTDDEGNVVEAAFETDDDLFDAGFREHLYAAVAVRKPGHKFTAATLQLQSAQCAALRQSIALLAGPAKTAEAWAQRSPAHAKSANAKVPGARFVTEIWSTLDAPKSGKGQPYNQGHGRTYPTPEADVAAFNAWTTAEWPKVQLVLAKYNLLVEKTRRIAERTTEVSA